MNKYVLTLAAAGLIAAAPAYYAFQAQAEENVPAGQVAAPSAADEAAADAAATTQDNQSSDAAAVAADKAAPAAGNSSNEGTNE